MAVRTLLVAGAILGVCYLAGVPVIDWLLSLVQVLTYVLSSLLWAFWQLLQPAQDTRHSTLPELHQAVLNVTNDAARVADLLEEFLSSSKYCSDPQLKAKFLQFMADQADTKYSVVDNKLNWVLWLYSLIWMPLLVLMCLTRMGKGAGAAERKHLQQQQQQYNPLAAQQPGSAGSFQQQQGAGGYAANDQAAGLRLSPSGSGGPFSSGDGSGLTTGPPGGFGGLTPRRRGGIGGGMAGSASLDLPPRYSVPGSFGGSRPYADDVDGSHSLRSVASSSGGRSLRSAIASGSIPRMRGSSGSSSGGGGVPRASSDRLHMSRPSKLHGAASMPVGVAKGGHPLGSGRGAGMVGRQKSLQGGGYGQALSARQGLGGPDGVGRYGNGGSSSGADVRAAGALDQAAALGGGSSSGVQAPGWSHKLQHRGGMLEDDDAAAAADAVAR